MLRPSTSSCRCAVRHARLARTSLLAYRTRASSSSGQSPSAIAGPSTFRPTQRGRAAFRSPVSYEGVRHLSTSSSIRSNARDAWTNLGVPLRIVHRLQEHYPHILRPTPAQRLFIASVGAGKEVFLKDDMGRGKTLALAITALTLAISSPDSAPRILIIVPTPHLAHQIYNHLLKLSPSASSDPSFVKPSETPFSLLEPPPTLNEPTKRKSSSGPFVDSPRLPLPSTPVILSTARALESYHLSLPQLTHILLDEPDTLLGSNKDLPSDLKAYHRINRHPPPIIGVLNYILGIRSTNKDKIDFSHRREDVNTIWTSATMSSAFLRFVKTRGWVKRGTKAVMIDFSREAKEKDTKQRERMLAALPSGVAGSGAVPETNVNSFVPETDGVEHYALVVDSETGDLSSLDPESSTSSSLRTRRDVKGKRQADDSAKESGSKLDPALVEALALVHTTSPSSSDTGYALALPPEGTSLDRLAEDLSHLGISTLVLTPELMQLGFPAFPKDETPILVAQRSSVPGLHLGDLETIYLLGGLDVGGLSPKQLKAGGVKDRWGFYQLVAGRLGRLGTSVKRGAGEQRVISLVKAGSEDQRKLGDMFERLPSSSRSKASENGQRSTDASGDTKRLVVLKEWDMEALQKRLTASLEAEE